MSSPALKKIVAIIPARGGSKGVPRKNIRQFNNKPLIAWTIEIAKQVSEIDRVIVSTDDAEIAGIAKAYGAEVPFLRPIELAADNVRDYPVCTHALEHLKNKGHYQPDLIVWLRPTAPLRIVSDVISCVNIALQSQADCVRTVCETEHHPYWMKTMEGGILSPVINGRDEGTYYNRQMMPEVFRLNGAVDIVNVEFLEKHELMFGGDMFGFVMPLDRSVDIDTELDFNMAETLLKKRIENEQST